MKLDLDDPIAVLLAGRSSPLDHELVDVETAHLAQEISDHDVAGRLRTIRALAARSA